MINKIYNILLKICIFQPPLKLVRSENILINSSSSSRHAPSTAMLWDSRSNRETLELAAAMEDAAFSAEFADTAMRAVAAALDERVQERTNADAAAQAPERAENGPGEGVAPQPLDAEVILRPGMPQEPHEGGSGDLHVC